MPSKMTGVAGTTPPMNKKWKRRWVAALRSGKYKQAEGQLRDDQGKFCCLGIACEIAKKELGMEWSSRNGFGGRRGLLPREVVKLFGLTTDNPIVSVCLKSSNYTGETEHTLSTVNDEPVSFKRIARLIEKQL